MRALVVLLLFGGAAAQADLSDDLKTCAEMADAASRLACFDAIGRVAEPAGDVADLPATPGAPTAPPTPLETPVPAEVVDEFGLDAVTAREREAIEKAASKAAEADAAIADKERKALEKAQLKAEKQAEQEREKAEREQLVTATITSVTRHVDRRFSVTLDNGQVWRETQGSRVGIPDEGASVELKRGRFGGYRMKIDGLSRVAWVKRTK